MYPSFILSIPIRLGIRNKIGFHFSCASADAKNVNSFGDFVVHVIGSNTIGSMRGGRSGSELEGFGELESSEFGDEGGVTGSEFCKYGG